MADEVVSRIPPELDGERIDKAIAVMLGVSRSVAREMIDAGVVVDGARVRPSDRVTAGAHVTAPEPPQGDELIPEPVDFGILYQDEHLVVIDKPAGLVVHPGSGRERGTLAAGLLHRFPELEGVGDAGRWGLVHRLDKETSGALVVARTRAAYSVLRGMIKQREVERIYKALVAGVFPVPTGTVDSPIGADRGQRGRRAVTREGKRAVTHYEVDRSFPREDCTLLTVRLETGRTHQIRVHFAAIGHPVIGDRTYATKTTRVSAPRQFLHAARLVFRHPITAATVDADSALPDDLSAVLATLEAK